VLLAVLIASETRLYGEGRFQVRHEFAVEGAGRYARPEGEDAS
jgi:hypothetical protein